MTAPPAQRRHWQRTRGLTALLLAVWCGVTFGVAWYGRELAGAFFGWPFSFWVAAQGALLVYVLIVWLYALAMRRIDRPLEGASDE